MVTWVWEPLSNECARGVRAATVKTRAARRDRAVERSTRIVDTGWTRANRTALTTTYWGWYLENGTRNRWVSIIATFILSFYPYEILSRPRIRYTGSSVETRGIVHGACLLRNGFPAFRSLNSRRCLSRRPGRLFFKGTRRNRELITRHRLTLSCAFSRGRATYQGGWVLFSLAMRSFTCDWIGN